MFIEDATPLTQEEIRGLKAGAKVIHENDFAGLPCIVKERGKGKRKHLGLWSTGHEGFITGRIDKWDSSRTCAKIYLDPGEEEKE